MTTVACRQRRQYRRGRQFRRLPGPREGDVRRRPLPAGGHAPLGRELHQLGAGGGADPVLRGLRPGPRRSPEQEVAFSVPTGNFGNVLAAWAARRMGLPVARLVVASNRNDILSRFLARQRHEHRCRWSRACRRRWISGVSSNFERLLFELLDRDAGRHRRHHGRASASTGRMDVPHAAWHRATTLMHGFRLDDEGTLAEIRRLDTQCGYLADPHTAIGVAAARALPCTRHVPIDRRPPPPTRPSSRTRWSARPAAARRCQSTWPTYMSGRSASPPRPTDLDTIEAPYPRLRTQERCMSIQSLPPALRPHRRHRADGPGGDRLPRRLRRRPAPGTRRRRRTAPATSSSTWRSRAPKRRSAAAIAEAVEDVGGHINAYTAREQTAYYVKLLKEDLALGCRHHRRHPHPQRLRPRGAGARARRDPAGDRAGQRHAGRHRVRPLPGDGLPGPADGPADAGAGGRASSTMGREVLTGYMRQPLHHQPTWWWPPPGQLGRMTASLALAAEHFADLAQGDGAASPSPACTRGGEFRETRDLDQVHIVLGFLAMSYADPDFYPSMLHVHAAGRRHVVAPVPGDPRAAGPGLLHLLLHRPRHGWRHVRASTPAPARRRRRS